MPPLLHLAILLLVVSLWSRANLIYAKFLYVSSDFVEGDHDCSTPQTPCKYYIALTKCNFSTDEIVIMGTISPERTELVYLNPGQRLIIRGYDSSARIVKKKSNILLSVFSVKEYEEPIPKLIIRDVTIENYSNDLVTMNYLIAEVDNCIFRKSNFGFSCSHQITIKNTWVEDARVNLCRSTFYEPHTMNYITWKNVTISNSVVVSNFPHSANVRGLDITMDDIVLIGNSSIEMAKSPSIVLQPPPSTLRISNLIAENNIIPISKLISIHEFQYINITRSVFRNNVAIIPGVYFGESSFGHLSMGHYHVSDTTFENNVAVIACLSFDGAYTSTVQNTIFKNNTASENAYFDIGSIAIKFEGHTSMTSDSQGTIIKNSIFEDNVGYISGAISSVGYLDLTIVDNVFRNNKANCASALYIQSFKTLILNNTFENNHFIQNAHQPSKGVITLESGNIGLFKNEIRDSNQDGIYIGNSALNSDCNIVERTKTGLISNYESTQSIVYIGKINSGWSARIKLFKSEIPTLPRETYRWNRNGGISLASFREATLFNTTVEYNQNDKGAGLYISFNRPRQELYFINLIVRHNIAHEEGGGVYLKLSEHPGSFLILESEIWNNSAVIGGALLTDFYETLCTVFVYTLILTENKAINGNNIYWKRKTESAMLLSFSEFEQQESIPHTFLPLLKRVKIESHPIPWPHISVKEPLTSTWTLINHIITLANSDVHSNQPELELNNVLQKQTSLLRHDTQDMQIIYAIHDQIDAIYCKKKLEDNRTCVNLYTCTIQMVLYDCFGKTVDASTFPFLKNELISISTSKGSIQHTNLNYITSNTSIWELSIEAFILEDFLSSSRVVDSIITLHALDGFTMQNATVPIYFERCPFGQPFQGICESWLRINFATVIYISISTFIIGMIFFLIVVCCILGLLALLFRMMISSKSKSKYIKLMNEDIQMLLMETGDDDIDGPKVSINKKLFEVNFNEIKIIKKIGSGGSGAVVFEVEWKGTRAALKLFRTTALTNETTYEAFEKEVEILSSCRHPGIIGFYGCSLKESRIGILMELCSLGSLRNYIESMSQIGVNALTFKDRVRILHDIALCMSYLHNVNVVHRDLKAENILLDENFRPKIIDFGLSKVLEGSENNTVRIGTRTTMAPELIRGGNYTDKVDVYSFGILLYQLLTDRFEVYGDDPQIEFKVASDPNFRPVLDKNDLNWETDDLDWYLSLMRSCWEFTPEYRPSFATVVKALRDHLD